MSSIRGVLKYAVLVYAGMLAILYGIVASGQILGFTRYYSNGLVIFLAFLLAAASLWFYLGEAEFFRHFLSGKAIKLRKPVRTSFIAAGILFFLILITVPMLLWPESPIGRSLTWDAGAYHFPKAVELYRSGSAWDLSVAYGDYPFGYESLLAFGLTLSGDELLFGFIHLMITLFFLATFWLLSSRYSRLPNSLLFFVSVLFLMSDIVTNPGHPQLISGVAFTIGKNDFLLGTALLAAILHSPIGSRNNENKYHLAGLAMSSMLAISIKPNGAIPLIPIWIYTIYLLLKKENGRITSSLVIKMAAAGIAMLPGLLWAVRNYIVLGRIFTPAAKTLASESIAANLLNPFLYTLNPPFILLAVTAIISILSIMIVKNTDALSLTLVGCNWLLFFTFIFTPATAFHRFTDVPSQIAWRFGISFVVINLLVLLLMLEKWLEKLLWRLGSHENIAVKIVIFWAFCGLILWGGSWLLDKEPQNRIILRDEYKEAVGTGGYYSAYDFIQKNIRNSVIHLENGLLYYAYGPGYTNTPTKLQYPLEMEDQVVQPVPDYFVIFKPDDVGADFPDSLESNEWAEKWELIYSDPEGRVYRKLQ